MLKAKGRGGGGGGGGGSAPQILTPPLLRCVLLDFLNSYCTEQINRNIHSQRMQPLIVLQIESVQPNISLCRACVRKQESEIMARYKQIPKTLCISGTHAKYINSFWILHKSNNGIFQKHLLHFLKPKFRNDERQEFVWHLLVESSISCPAADKTTF